VTHRARITFGLSRTNSELPRGQALKAQRAVADRWRDRRDRPGALENFTARKERSN